jgi:hypothetical protein
VSDRPLEARGEAVGGKVFTLRSPSVCAALASRWLFATIVAAGAAVRIAQYLADRALWSDEAYLALNLLHRSPSELVQRLDFNQAAPILFLLLEKAAITVFGASELALRFIPLVCGVLSLFAFARLAKRLLHPAAAPLALLLFATADGLVYYSSELKPYSLDVLAAVVLLLAGDHLLTSRASFRRLDWILLTAASVLLLFASYAALFVAAGVVLSLAIDIGRRWDRKRLRRLAPVVTIWICAAAAALLLVLRQMVGVAEGPSIMDPSWVSALGSAIASSLAYSPGGVATKLAAGVAVAGFVRIAVKDRRRGLLLGSSFAFTMIAVFSNHYPLFPRTVLFLIPIVILFLAEGVAALALLFRGRARAVASVALALLVSAVPVASAAEHLLRPRTHEELTPVLGFVAQHWRRGDTLYLQWGSQYAFRYYAECNCFDSPGRLSLAERWRFEPRSSSSDHGPALASSSAELVVGSYPPDAVPYLAQLGPLERQGRLWIIFSHAADAEEATFLNTALPQALAAKGKMLLAFKARGAGAYLFDFGKRP